MLANQLVQFDKDLLKFFVGFDTHLEATRKATESLKNQKSYPPYNIKTVGDNSYIIEIAVAGFSRSDIDVELWNKTLTVTGKSAEPDDSVYLYKGLASRAFTRTFTIADNVKVNEIKLNDGMLRIYLDHVIPEEFKPRKLEINTSTNLLIG